MIELCANEQKLAAYFIEHPEYASYESILKTFPSDLLFGTLLEIISLLQEYKFQTEEYISFRLACRQFIDGCQGECLIKWTKDQSIEMADLESLQSIEASTLIYLMLQQGNDVIQARGHPGVSLTPLWTYIKSLHG